MKRVVSILMAATMMLTGATSMCFAADAADSADGSISVKVVISDATQSVVSGDISFDISESITLKAEIDSTEAQVSPLVIKNKTEGMDLTMTAIGAEGKNGWEVVPQADIEGAATDARYIGLFLDDNSLNKELTVDDGVITEGATRSFLLDGSIAKQSTPVELSSVATLVVTIRAGGASDESTTGEDTNSSTLPPGVHITTITDA